MLIGWIVESYVKIAALELEQILQAVRDPHFNLSQLLRLISLYKQSKPTWYTNPYSYPPKPAKRD